MVGIMIEWIVDILIKRQLSKQMMGAEDIKIYRYGYILLCEVVLNFVAALIIGVAFYEIFTVVFFLCMYIPLRSFCGGWHAKEIWKCSVISCVILLLQIYCIKYIINYLTISRILIIFVISIVWILYIAPIETQMKRISKGEKNIYKKKVCVIVFIHFILVLKISEFNMKKFVFSMMYVYIIQSVMLLVELIKQRIFINK